MAALVSGLYLPLLQEEKPPLTKEKSSRFANFFQSETSAPGAALGPGAGMQAPGGSAAAGQSALQNPFTAQLGGQALLQQLQAAERTLSRPAG